VKRCDRFCVADDGGSYQPGGLYGHFFQPTLMIEGRVQLRSLTTDGIDFEVANVTAPLERIMQSFGSVPRGPVRIEVVTAERCSWFPYRARAAPT
jgi:hypothetical protein